VTTATDQHFENYQVDLPVFNGPLDLLLYLIKKEEVDIYDIPIARITKQYLKYLELMTELNLEVAGEFVLMAATLIRIKARLLLPRDESSEDEFDPREELIMALVEYKKYREASEILREKALLEERNFVPPSTVSQVDKRVEYLPDTTLFDLLTAFRDVLASRHDETFHQVKSRQVSIEERIAVIIKFLGEREFATFAELFADLPRRIIAIVTFIALLELVRTHRVRIYQSAPFGEVRVYRGNSFTSELSDLGIEQEMEPQKEVINA
jgi:segregation and condensation protein A